MNIRDLLQDKNYHELHVFLSKFILQLESKLLIFLENNKRIEHLVWKEVEYGIVNEEWLIQRDKKKSLITYSLDCSFFEFLEDEYGQRSNDITIDFILILSDLNDIVLTRHIVSEYLDEDYTDIEFKSLTTELIDEISKMETSYFRIVENFFLNKAEDVHNGKSL